MQLYLRRAVFSYSLASLYLLKGFNEFPMYRPAREAYWGGASQEVMIGGLLGVFLLGCVLFGVTNWIAGWGNGRVRARRIIDGVFVFSLVIPAHHLFELVARPKIPAQSAVVAWILIRVAIFAAAVTVALLQDRRLYRLFLGSVLVVSPLYPMTLLRALVFPAAEAPARLAERQAKVPERRVVWLIFDEADMRAMEESAADVQMPEWARLRTESLYMKDAYAAGAFTLASIPAMVTGRWVEDLRAINGSELRVRFEGAAGWEVWGKQGTVFSAVQQMGWNSAVSGWYHPYCRVFGEILSDCYARPFPAIRGLVDGKASILEALYSHLTEALISLPLVERLGWLEPIPGDERHIAHDLLVRGIRDRALKQVADAGLAFVLVHLPVPHMPGIYDRRTKKFSPKGTYLDNLALADVVLGDMRRAMERSGTWGKSAVVVTSDHSWRDPVGRKQDTRIPLLVKLPEGMGGGVEYQEPVSTLVLSGLTMALLKGKLRNSEETVAWLKSKATPIDRERRLIRNYDIHKIFQ